MSDFVKPEVVRLPLSGGQFIDVKKRLNHGEREDLRERWWVDDHGVMQRQGRGIRTNMVLAYLIGWSLTDDDKPVAYSPELTEAERAATLRSLAPARFDEIHQAIDAHEDAGNAQKKMPDGGCESSPISPSPACAAGATTTL